MVSYENATRKLTRFIGCNCCWIYDTQNFSYASSVESTALSLSLVNYNHPFLLRTFITLFSEYKITVIIFPVALLEPNLFDLGKNTVWKNWNKCHNLVKPFGRFKNNNKLDKTLSCKDISEPVCWKQVDMILLNSQELSNPVVVCCVMGL